MICYLDMDGVLTDFNAAICGAHGQPLLNKRVEPKDFGLTAKQFWAPCNHENFWVDMNWTHDGKIILKNCEQIFDDVIILTSPTLGGASWSGKIKWLVKNAPDYVRRAILIPSKIGEIRGKSLLAKPDTILVDDDPENIEAFVEAGGQVALVGRPWNSRYYGTTIQLLETLRWKSLHRP